MAEYISKEALMATVDEWQFSIEDFGCFVQELEQIPAADVVEVAQGDLFSRWVEDHHRAWQVCGVCYKGAV